MTQQEQDAREGAVDQAVAQGGAYEVIRKRLQDQSQKLKQSIAAINQARVEEFGGSELAVTGRVRIRTENNCIPRDIVQVGNHLLFGYNVFIGLKKETRVADVFALYQIDGAEQGFDIAEVDMAGTFLAERAFVNDFEELYRYYKHTKLTQLRVKDGKLLAAFQIGERLDDIRVFRWALSADQKQATYIDNRGERDIQLPPPHDFTWVETSRENIVHGRHPHINIEDTLFVETVGGDLTIKVENNTEVGLGIYREPVEDKTQSLDDAQFFYATVGELVLLKIRPYREQNWRFFIYNKFNEKVIRQDAIGQSCVQLPEDHGIIFPGGFYLQTGEHKTFDERTQGLNIKRTIRSPNGEDVLYVFYEPSDGIVVLLNYNMIEKSLGNPITAHGYALAENGRLVVFTADPEPSRVHPLQVWQTPYMTPEFASKAPTKQSFYGRIGNAELVRGISDIFSIVRLIENQSVSARIYNELSQSARKVFDDHYWLEDEQTAELAGVLHAVGETAELVIDEFEKVQSIQAQSKKAMQEAEQQQASLLQEIRPDEWQTTDLFVAALANLRRQRGHLITIKSLRYIDVEKLVALDNKLQVVEAELTEKTLGFLADPMALESYREKIENINASVEAAAAKAELDPVLEAVDAAAEQLDLLTELMTGLQSKDAKQTTIIIESISAVYSALNQAKAKAVNKRKNLGSEEAVAQFGAQFKLFNQSIENALGLSTSPDKCDEQLSRLLMQLEELEGQFSEFENFLTDIMDKRDEVYESFEAHKQKLLDERQRKAQSLADNASRMLASIEKRSLKFNEKDELNTYFASDGLVLKVRQLIQSLKSLDSQVQADDVESRFKALQEQALRSLRDKSEIYEAGGSVIKLGPRHKFSVNSQELDLTIIPRQGKLNIHLTGTDYFEPIQDQELNAQKVYWEQSLASETPTVARAEYLAYSILSAAENNTLGLSLELLQQSILDPDNLNKLVRDFATPRYKEGYQKGIHDHDASRILQALLPQLASADLLSYTPGVRALAQLYWFALGQIDKEQQAGKLKDWSARARSADLMQQVLKSRKALTLLEREVATELALFVADQQLTYEKLQIEAAAAYLVAEFARDSIGFITSKYARNLVAALQASMDDVNWRGMQKTLSSLSHSASRQYNLACAWLEALSEESSDKSSAHFIEEAAILLCTSDKGALVRRDTEVDLVFVVDQLLGDHPLIEQGKLTISLDSFLEKMARHQRVVVPSYHDYLELKQSIVERERKGLRLNEFKARPLSSFVRNRLINESYLPLIGDNLAKQMGTVGEDKRTDLMGLLMMISPPGYGKTTLMEYVASRLGLIFMKINCPSLGHHVLSLDPAQAPNATARQELEKLNLALEMGNNVMLYLDDIQHTDPEFLQKFISLCDGTRRIEGVWRGATKTYDMRGKKFCVVMAGNPYTESGEAFKIPDMLANRADIYNLGDILGGMDEQFALSYIENSLTSNPVLAPLATREMADVYRLVKLAQGENIATTELHHGYSASEIAEITGVLRKMMVVRDVVLKINQQYIASAAQDDKYRTEPAFKLQGSYRNMNKMTEKISAVMNEAELMQMIADHYQGEAQLLTTGAEANLLKLAELRGNMTENQQQRWSQIKQDYLRNKAMGGDDADVGGKVVAQLVDLVQGVQSLSVQAKSKAEMTTQDQQLAAEKIIKALAQVSKSIKGNQPHIEVINQPVPGIDKILHALADTIEHSISPLVKSMDKKLEIDLRTHDKMQEVSQQLRALAKAESSNKISIGKE